MNGVYLSGWEKLIRDREEEERKKREQPAAEQAAAVPTPAPAPAPIETPSNPGWDALMRDMSQRQQTQPAQTQPIQQPQPVSTPEPAKTYTPYTGSEPFQLFMAKQAYEQAQPEPFQLQMAKQEYAKKQQEPSGSSAGALTGAAQLLEMAKGFPPKEAETPEAAPTATEGSAQAAAKAAAGKLQAEMEYGRLAEESAKALAELQKAENALASKRMAAGEFGYMMDTSAEEKALVEARARAEAALQAKKDAEERKASATEAYYGALQSQPDYARVAELGEQNGKSKVTRADELRKAVESGLYDWDAEALNGLSREDIVVYGHLTDGERQMYHYLLNAFGEKEADRFLDNARETLNAREGKKQADILESQPTWARIPLELIQSGAAGTMNAVHGLTQNLHRDAQKTSPLAYESQFTRQYIQDHGAGSRLEGAAYDVVNTGANMVPSLMVGAINPVAGAATMALQSKGNAYKQALDEGYTKGQAQMYSTIVGTAEGGLQYLLGGFSKLGGLEKFTKGLTNRIGSQGLRALATIGIDIIGENTEEYLQNKLEPLIRNNVFGENNEIKLWDDNDAYTVLITTLSTGLMNGGDLALSAAQTAKLAPLVGEAWISDGTDGELVEHALTSSDPAVRSYAQAMKQGDRAWDSNSVGNLAMLYQDAGGDIGFTLEKHATVDKEATEALREAQTEQQTQEPGVAEKTGEMLDEAARLAQEKTLPTVEDFTMKEQTEPTQQEAAAEERSAGNIVTPTPDETARTGETERLNRAKGAGAEAGPETAANVPTETTEAGSATAPAEEAAAVTGSAQTALMSPGTVAPAAAEAAAGETGIAPRTGQTESGEEGPAPGMKRSQTESNSLTGVAEKLGGEQNPLYYMPVTERQTLTEAVNRVQADGVGEMERLAAKDHWTAADVDTAMTIYGKLQADGVRNGRDFSAAQSWAKVIQSRGTSTAQSLQAFAKWTRSGSGQAAYIQTQLDEAVADYEASGGKRGVSPEEAARISNEIYDFAEAFDSLDENDVEGLRGLIKKMSDRRNTGTFFKGNFDKLLQKETDADYLREYALRQMMAVASDATDTADLGQKLKTWQVNAQLTRLGTFFRNIGGNMTFGIQDTLAQDGLGIALDYLASRFTGKRTVGLDKSWFSSKARKAAGENLRRSVLEIAGDVDMGGSTRYGTTSSRTFKMTGNAFERFMSRWEQLLGYSLQSSDAFSRGQIEAATKEGLDSIDSGLTEEQKTELAESTADYRLFQNKGTAYGISKGVHDIMNLIGGGGEVDKAHPQRGRQGGFGLGDMLNPYPGVPANLGAKIAEYSPLNAVKGGVEFVKVLKALKMGNFDPAKQNQAVMDVARGLSGAPIIALLAAAFKSGVVRNSDDEDDLDAAAQNRAEGKTGVQINLDAFERGLKGESTEWRDGDDLMSIGWMEPLNGFMAIASLMAQDESEDGALESYAKHSLNGALQAITEIPAMKSISDIYDTLKYSTGETIGEKAADAAITFAGDALTGMIPAPISQLAKTIDPYYRDTAADSEAEQVWNNVKNLVPGLRETLPVKQDNYGEPKKAPDSAMQRFLNNFVLPGAVNEIHQTDVSKSVMDLYEATGDEKVVPDRKAPSSVKVDGEQHRLTAAEKREWQDKYGGRFGEMAEIALRGADFDILTDDEKAAVVQTIEQYAGYEAKRALFDTLGLEYTDSAKENLRQLAEADPEDAVRYVAAREKLDRAIEAGDAEAIDRLLEDGGLYDGLSDEAKEMLGSVQHLTKLVDLRGEGVEAESAMKVIDAIGDMKTELGKSGDLSIPQALDAILGTDLTDKEKKAALKVYTSDNFMEQTDTALKAGLSLDKWGEVYTKFADIKADEDLKAGQKATQFAAALDRDKSLSKKQKDVLKDTLVYFNMSPAEAKRYEQLSDEGISIDKAQRISEELRGVDKQADQVQTIVGMKGISEAERWAALKVYASEPWYNDASAAYKKGIDLEDYVRDRRAADKNEDGGLSQGELYDFYKETGNETFAKVMWQIISTKQVSDGKGGTRNNWSGTWEDYKRKHGG